MGKAAHPKSRIFYVYTLRVKHARKPFYVGKGHDNRADSHFTESSLARASHKNHTILKAWSSDKSIYVEYVMQNLTEKQAFDLEENLIAFYGRRVDDTGVLTNLTLGGEGASGALHSAEHRRKNSEANKGRVLSAETRLKLASRPKRVGWTHSVETRARMSQSHTGAKKSDETKAKMSLAASTRVRKPHSEETKAKMRASHLGKKHSAETKDRLRVVNKGKVISEETRARMSASQQCRQSSVRGI